MIGTVDYATGLVREMPNHPFYSGSFGVVDGITCLAGAVALGYAGYKFLMGTINGPK